jgi:dipeptidyl aminopeptidase/acylaminoacyl peptidase
MFHVSASNGDPLIPNLAAGLATRPVVSKRNSRARPLDLDALYSTRSILSFRWSHDGKQIYFDANITGRFNIWRVPAVGGRPVQITNSDERTLLEDPSPDGRFLLYTKDVGGNEKPNLFLIDLRTGDVRNITNTEGVCHRDMCWSPDGKTLVCAAERERPGAYSIFKIEAQTAIVTRIAGSGDGECASLQWSPDGRKLAFTRTRNYLHAGVSVLDLETGKETILVPIDLGSTNTTMGWARDNKNVYVTSNANGKGVDAVALLGLDQSGFEWLTLGTWDSYFCDSSRTQDCYVYVRNEGGNHRIFLRTLKEDEIEIPLPGGVVKMARFSPDGKQVGLLHSSADTPGEIWVYDISARKLKQITNSLIAELNRESFVQGQLVVYPSFDLTQIAAFLYLPANIERDNSHPALVVPHGGPTWQHVNDWFLSVQYFVSHGYVVIAPNYRGSTGYGRDFMEANRGDCGGEDVRDCVAAVEFLKKTGYVDSHRIAFMGASYGGYLTLMALAKFPALWSAGVAVAPFANWFTAYENEDPVLQASDEWLMGTPVKDGELWRDRSPVFFADQIRAPLCMLGGENDRNCPVEEIQQMAEAVRHAGGLVEVTIYRSEGHELARRENEIDAQRRIANFLQEHVRKKTLT